MKTLKQLRESHHQYEDSYGGNTTVLSEEFHEALKTVLDSSIDPKHKLNAFTKKARELLKNGETTGLDNEKAIKGSSRAVFLSKENKPIHIDGVATSIPTATKIAFMGALDKHTGEKELLGEMQNRQEADNFAANHYSVLKPTRETNHFEHDPEGVLAPVLSYHPDYHHIEFGKITKPTSATIKEATKTPEFPKGISHEQIYDAINHSYAQANGQKHYSAKPSLDANRDKIKEHPFVEKLTDFAGNTGMHPADMSIRNLGIWEHPVNKTKHLVVSDYGASTDILKHYSTARKNMAKLARGY